ncbi:hypothetical protein A3C60_00625 [Candidatus Nomurabacteria bacterium RIFCSPHIGHO2_02_FULL_37_45]|nr:MAG: hypothetical protein A2727_00595 [Candidatus Nomurabacteria bacterium RIFCSPHIGHO2_01_FULL_37_110]OGI71453.1 MAG: hypothetical protein A3C60_00625 [Candidatus Nomurabacteria bacterium RIFCSPHIGHO2_02_FULL_37_45]OGI85455.1 MAG: hypothetical protein A3A92_00255 [Candidatus Nomurabacteria bacterium RIFCSPLOWO2_01_FULL_37_49]
MKKNISSFVLAVVFFILLFVIPKDHRNIKAIQIMGQNIRVNLATTDAAREQGLSGRENLKEDEGMLFVFDYPDKYSFWMKDMNFPIDMIWIGENKEIIYIKKNARPESFPESYGPTADSKYVLEIVSGLSSKNNLKEGDKVEFKY